MDTASVKNARQEMFNSSVMPREGGASSFVGWAKARLRRAHHQEHGKEWWARYRFAHPTPYAA
jgi:hypothetical protein